jgi:hypothetical protein
VSARIVRCIDNVNMGLGHPGLSELARKFKLYPEKLAPQECIVFLNRAKDKLKVMGSEGRVIAYLRMPRGQRMRLESIQYIPQIFAATGKIDYDAACKESLIRSLGTGKEGKPTPSQIYQAARSAGVIAST